MSWVVLDENFESYELRLGTLVKLNVFRYEGDGGYRARVNDKVDFEIETTGERQYLTKEEAKSVALARAKVLIDSSYQELIKFYLVLKSE